MASSGSTVGWWRFRSRGDGFTPGDRGVRVRAINWCGARAPGDDRVVRRRHLIEGTLLDALELLVRLGRAPVVLLVVV
eukprot:245076-Prymnesium_polylepis.1